LTHKNVPQVSTQICLWRLAEADARNVNHGSRRNAMLANRSVYPGALEGGESCRRISLDAGCGERFPPLMAWGNCNEVRRDFLIDAAGRAHRSMPNRLCQPWSQMTAPRQAGIVFNTRLGGNLIGGYLPQVWAPTPIRRMPKFDATSVCSPLRLTSAPSTKSASRQELNQQATTSATPSQRVP